METKCSNCGKPHPRRKAYKVHGNYCSDACRQSAYRKRRKTSPEHLADEIRALARRAEELAREASSCTDTFVGRGAQDDLKWVAQRLHGAAGMIDPEPLPFT